MCDNKPIQAEVYNIFTFTYRENVIDKGIVASNTPAVLYELTPYDYHREDIWDLLNEEECYAEEDCYPTKEELLKSL